MYVFDTPGDAGTMETITPGDTATGITKTIRHPISGVGANTEATGALLSVEDNTINFSIDGTTPTNKAGTNVGHKMDANQSYVIRGVQAVKDFKCVDRVSSSAGVVKVTPFFGP